MNVPICLITDETYLFPTTVTIKSLFDNAHRNTFYNVVVIVTENISNKAKDMFKELNCKNGSIKVLISPIVNMYNDVSMGKRHVSTAALYKFNLPEILNDFDKALYIDSDIVIQKDLSKLLSIDLSDNYVAAVESFSAPQYIDNLYENLNIKYYFNSGVMLLNLKLMRENDITEKLIDYKLNGWNHFMDQDALNAVFGNKVVLLSPYYNLQFTSVCRFSAKELCKLYDVPIVNRWGNLCLDSYILHYNSKEKPWKYDNVWQSDVWRYYYNKLPNNIRNSFKLEHAHNPNKLKIEDQKPNMWLVKIKRILNKYFIYS